MISRLKSFSKQTWAKLAGMYAGIVFGIYWIPVRFMDEAGIYGMWAVLVFNLVSFTLILPWVLYRWREFVPGRLRLHFGAGITGLAYVLYVGAFLYSEVIRVLVLFYLMPIWGFVFARIFVGEAITAVRWISMLLGLTGLLVICGIQNGIPVPSGIGDWMALLSGLLWAGISISVLTDRHEPLNYSVTFLFWSVVWSILIAIVASRHGVLSSPQWHQLGGILVWLVPLAMLVIIPAAFATMYAPSILNPGIVGLLFMTEISVGTITAALFAGEPFGITEIAGVLLITIAGVAEPLHDLVRKGR